MGKLVNIFDEVITDYVMSCFFITRDSM